jgi:hypothetical protein
MLKKVKIANKMQKGYKKGCKYCIIGGKINKNVVKQRNHFLKVVFEL